MTSLFVALLALLLATPAAQAAPKTRSGKPAASAPSTPTAPARPGRATDTKVPTPAPKNALPDSFVLARVEDRVIRVFDYRDHYFASDATIRSQGDSTGRVEFLNNLVNKEVMGLTALEVNRPLTYEDRLTMRGHTNTVLQNVLYRRLVTDSVQVRDDEIAPYFKQFDHQPALRAIRFADRATAQAVRTDLLRGRIGWREAVRRYSREFDPANPEGDVGWVKRSDLWGELAFKVYALEPGSTSEAVQDMEGWRLYRCVGKRPVKRLSEPFMRTVIIRDLRLMRNGPLVERFYARVRALSGVVYDSTNIRWTAAKIKEALEARESLAPNTLDLSETLPDFGAADTARVLARTHDRQITLGQFLTEYSSIPVLSRSQIVSLEPFIFAFDGPALEPERFALARELGIEKDPLAVQLIEDRREEMLVEHLFQDSVSNNVVVTPDMRREYYRQREKEFLSIPRVRYARFVRFDQASAESLIARLKAGERAEDILRADSLGGDDTTGTIEEIAQNDPVEYRKLLFEELRPGQAARIGPDRQGRHLVFQVLRYDEARKLSFEEMQGFLDESLQNMESERLLKEFLARHRARYRIESHPELVMRITLTDPAMEKVMKQQ